MATLYEAYTSKLLFLSHLQLEETVYSMVMRYGLRLIKLRVLNAELKFIIR